MVKSGFNRSQSTRDGVSVIEVLFAMGVVVIGLLGIASLLPLASKNASESLRFAEAQAFSNDWYSQFSVRGMNTASNWIMYRDFSMGPPNPAKIQYFDKQLASTVSTRGCSPTPASVTLQRELGRESVCLDPYFFAFRDVEQPRATNWASTTSRSQSNWYRPAVFPYYQDTYNPLVDSAYPANIALAWQAQPRMVRVSLPNAFSTAAAPAALSLKNLEQTFLSTDDFAMQVDNKDLTIPPARIGGSKFSSLNHYSWLATMCPEEPTPTLSTESTNYYTISLVVVHNRDLSLYDPARTGPRGAGDAAPEDKPQGEQLMWVESVSGDFVGGSGGRVRLIAADGTKEQLEVGGWVMLARTYAATLVSPGVYRPFTRFRWYRIIAVEQDAEGALLATPPLPYQKGQYSQVAEAGVTSGNNVDVFGVTVPNNVWGRYVTLEGPDWDFDSPVSGLVTPTTATYVKGARAVIERVVTVN